MAAERADVLQGPGPAERVGRLFSFWDIRVSGSGFGVQGLGFRA